MSLKKNICYLALQVLFVINAFFVGDNYRDKNVQNLTTRPDKTFKILSTSNHVILGPGCLFSHVFL